MRLKLRLSGIGVRHCDACNRKDQSQARGRQ
jgi:hypothetical protein